MRSFTFTLKTDCPYCGHMVAVNGPARATTCSSCQKDVALNPLRWGEQLGCATQGSRIVNNPYKCIPVGDSGDAPVCPECEGLFSFDSSWIGLDYDFDCPHCGFAHSTYPTPDWLAAKLPSVRQIVGGARPSDDGRAAPFRVDEQATKPVVLSCPNCSGSLKITAASERTVPCDHCSVEVYLPDGLWTRLHPVQTVRPWTVVFEEQLETHEQRDERQAEGQRALAAAQEATRAREAAERSQVEAAAEEGRYAKLLILFVVAMFVIPIVATIVFGLVAASGILFCM